MTALDAALDDIAALSLAPARPVALAAQLQAFWDEGRDGPDEGFTMRWEPVAVEGDRAVVRVDVAYDRNDQVYADLWIMYFGPDGRGATFEEWPFWPGKAHTADG